LLLLPVAVELRQGLDAVHEQVGVAREPKTPLGEPLVVFLPLLAQPGDRRGREAGRVLAQKLLQRRPEVAG
jgi:hypothetical protein